jgi:hypothetical protein
MESLQAPSVESAERMVSMRAIEALASSRTFDAPERSALSIMAITSNAARLAARQQPRTAADPLSVFKGFLPR